MPTVAIRDQQTGLNVNVATAVDPLTGANAEVVALALGQGRATASVAVTAGTSGDNTLVAATAGIRLRVYAYQLVAAGVVSVKFRGALGGTDLTGAMPLAANGQLGAQGEPSGDFFKTPIGGPLVLNLSAAVTVTGWVAYVAEAA